MKRWIHGILAMMLAVALASCGGGGGGLADGGIGGTGISRGSVTSFGSIVVNGQRFDTASAGFELDGLTDTEQALRIGYVTRVEADFDDATARTVHFTPDVVGAPIRARAR